MNKPIEIAIEDIDLGTPAALSDSTVTVHIDGQAVEVPAGTSVMRAASLAGTQIPKLCANRQSRCLWILSPLSGGNRGAKRNAGLVHHTLPRGHVGKNSNAPVGQASKGRDGALYFRITPSTV